MITEEQKIKRREACRRWRLKNPEYQKQWKEKNPGKTAEYTQAWRARNPEKARSSRRRWMEEHGKAYYQKWWESKGFQKRRDIILKNKYGVPHGWFAEQLAKQKGACAICGSSPESESNPSRFFHVDHNHQTGQVRQLLCRNCNWLIGNAKESIRRLVQTVEYLKKHGVCD